MMSLICKVEKRDYLVCSNEAATRVVVRNVYVT